MDRSLMSAKSKSVWKDWTYCVDTIGITFVELGGGVAKGIRSNKEMQNHQFEIYIPIRKTTSLINRMNPAGDFIDKANVKHIPVNIVNQSCRQQKVCLLGILFWRPC
jgi:hypothetical protein